MTALLFQQRTAKILLDWWYFTGKEHFLDYAIKTIALFDIEGKRGYFEGQCREAIKKAPPSRKQIELKRMHPKIIVDIDSNCFLGGKWVGSHKDEERLEVIHSALLNTYGLK